MKNFSRILLVVVLIMAVSACSKNDITPKGSEISPPEWLIGSWGNGRSVDFVFKKDDFCYVSSGFESCFKARVEMYKDVPQEQMKMKVEQQRGNNTYIVRFIQAGNTTSYEFHQKSSNEIIWRHDGHDIPLVKM